MSTRRFRPGFHRSQFFGLVPPARLVERTPARLVVPKVPLIPLPRLKIYDLLMRSGGTEQIYATDLAEARELTRRSEDCHGITLHHGEFYSGGVTVRVREGRALP